MDCSHDHAQSDGVGPEPSMESMQDPKPQKFAAIMVLYASAAGTLANVCNLRPVRLRCLRCLYSLTFAAARERVQKASELREPRGTLNQPRQPLAQPQVLNAIDIGLGCVSIEFKRRVAVPRGPNALWLTSWRLICPQKSRELGNSPTSRTLKSLESYPRHMFGWRRKT